MSMPVHPEALRKINDERIAVDFEALGRAAEEFELDLIILHGSYARGSARSDSDVHIAVWTRRRDYGKREPEKEAEWHLTLVAAINAAVEAPQGCDVRVLNHCSGLFAFCVASESVPLFEADTTTFWEFCSYAARRFDDEEPLRRSLHQYQRERIEQQRKSENRSEAGVSSARDRTTAAGTTGTASGL